MALPTVDFGAIKGTAQEAIAAYGSPATFQENGSPTTRSIKVVVYRDAKAQAMVQDAHSVPAQMLLSPADFQTPYRFPQQFDTVTVDIEGFKRIYTIDEIHPVMAESKLALLIATIMGN